MTSGTIPGVWKLIRGGNLMMMALVMFLVRYTVIIPLLEYEGLYSAVTPFAFNCLVAATVLLAASGNVINDIMDVAIDNINKPGKNPVDLSIPRKTAWILYFFLIISGMVMGYLASHYTFGSLFFIFPVSAGLLYFYSTSYKHLPLLGNIVISGLTALVVVNAALFDLSAISFRPVLLLITGYSVFAFLMTFSREILKDCEDVAGDARFESKTIAVLLGVTTARMIATAIIVLTVSLLVWIQVFSEQWNNLPAFLYVTILIDLPLLLLAWKTIRADSSQMDGRNATISKLIMISGILSMLVFYVTF